MVGRGEVDDDLEGEVAEECTKFGQVVKCTVLELADQNVHDSGIVIIHHYIAFMALALLS